MNNNEAKSIPFMESHEPNDSYKGERYKVHFATIKSPKYKRNPWYFKLSGWKTFFKLLLHSREQLPSFVKYGWYSMPLVEVISREPLKDVEMEHDKDYMHMFTIPYPGSTENRGEDDFK